MTVFGKKKESSSKSNKDGTLKSGNPSNGTTHNNNPEVDNSGGREANEAHPHPHPHSHTHPLSIPAFEVQVPYTSHSFHNY